MAEVRVRIRRLPHGRGLEAPARASSESAGLDLRAAVDTPLEVAPGQRVLVPTGFVMELPPGWEGQIRPRSGLAARFGITLLNTPGTLDSDYRGEIQVLMIHHGSEPFTIQRGDRIAQLVIAPVAQVRLEEVEGEELRATDRGGGGFGSTGR